MFGYSTQIQYFRDRFQSPALGMILFPILVGLVIPYVLINILGSGQTIQKRHAAAFPGLIRKHGRRNTRLARLRRGLPGGIDCTCSAAGCGAWLSPTGCMPRS